MSRGRSKSPQTISRDLKLNDLKSNKNRKRYDLLRNIYPVLAKKNVNKNAFINQVKKRGKKKSLEDYVFVYGIVPTLALAQKIGMIIPPYFNKDEYFVNNLYDYNTVITRNPTKINIKSNRNLRSFTDLELLTYFKIYFGYFSRRDLVLTLSGYRRGKKYGGIYFYQLLSKVPDDRNNMRISYGDMKKIILTNTTAELTILLKESNFTSNTDHLTLIAILRLYYLSLAYNIPNLKNTFDDKYSTLLKNISTTIVYK